MKPTSTNPANWLRNFHELGAVWQLPSPRHPHVKTSMSGQHVDAYFNSDLITSRPDIVDAIIESVLCLSQYLNALGQLGW